MNTASAALSYHRAGLSVIPILPGTKRPAHPDWQERTLTPDEIERVFSENRYEIGVHTGIKSGNLVDLDLDSDEAVVLARYYAPTTGAIFGRPSKPRSHYLYRVVDELPKYIAVNHPGGHGMMVELRGDGHQTLLPPSRHPSNERIEWWRQDGPADVLSEDIVRATNIIGAGSILAKVWPISSRHWVVMHLAGALLRARWTVEEVDQFVRGICEAAGDEEPQDRVRAVYDTAEKLDEGEEVTGWPSLIDIVGIDVVRRMRQLLGLENPRGMFDCNDLGNMHRLVHHHGQDIRYCPPKKKWYIWDGRCWKLDLQGGIYQRAKDVVNIILQEARDEPNEERQARLAKWAAATGQAGRVFQMVRLAESEPAVVAMPDEFDSDPYLLGCPNGTLDLRTGGLRSPQREDMITMQTRVACRPEKRSQVWEDWLEQTFQGKQDLIDYVQRAAGYSLTGDRSEDCYFNLLGETRTGKTTISEAFLYVMGDYAAMIRAETLSRNAQGPGASHDDLADAIGKRLVVTSETEEGQRMASALLKRLTGGSTIKARRLYEDFVEFVPSFKIWLDTNFPPLLPAHDDAIWRRVRTLPFERQLTEEEKDDKLRDRLKKEEGEAILAWMIRGCLQWIHDGGLGEPIEVKQASSAYRGDMDVVGLFVREMCVLGEGQRVRANTLYRAYRGWCQDQGERPMRESAFRNAIQQQPGVDRKSIDKHPYWIGININFPDLLEEGGPGTERFGRPMERGS